MKAIFSTCWYRLDQTKTCDSKYKEWMKNMFLLFGEKNTHSKLYVYTDENSVNDINDALGDTTNSNISSTNSNISIVIKPIEQFYNYKYKEYFIQNHTKNNEINSWCNWKLNMLWCEKQSFVCDTISRYQECSGNSDNNVFYLWCDIGYFRQRNPVQDSYVSDLYSKGWPSIQKLETLDKNKIYYALVQNSSSYINYIYSLVQNKNENGLPVQPLPPNQISVAGGFFIGGEKVCKQWRELFDSKLELYFKHDYLVKDDQMVIIDCILSKDTFDNFILVTENTSFDNWFLFSRFLI